MDFVTPVSELSLEDRVAKLTDQHRHWLRRISEGWTVDDIAAKIKISDSKREVERRLEIARNLLGASSIDEAAEIFQQHDDGV